MSIFEVTTWKENGNKEFEGIYYSRFIASWVNVGGSLKFRDAYLLKEWLRTLTINGKKIPEEVIREIYNLATNGKLELETSAKRYLEVGDFSKEKILLES